MEHFGRMERWLNEHWVPAALCVAIALTLLLPLVALHWGLAQLLIYAMLPVYMFHQVEEHTGDRFRIFVNEKVFGGVEALSHAAVLWINLPGVWGVGLLSVYAATFVGPGWGLSMVYLVLVNSVAHLVAAGVWRQYNPGLWTTLALFIPLGSWALVRTASEPGVSRIQHFIGLVVAIGIHVAIVIYTRQQKARIVALGRSTA